MKTENQIKLARKMMSFVSLYLKDQAESYRRGKERLLMNPDMPLPKNQDELAEIIAKAFDAAADELNEGEKP